MLRSHNENQPPKVDRLKRDLSEVIVRSRELDHTRDKLEQLQNHMKEVFDKTYMVSNFKNIINFI